MKNPGSTELLVRQDGDHLHLTLNRPNVANALSPVLVDGLISAFETANGVRLCTIRGEGKHFCSGFDLSDVEELSDGDLLLRFLRIEHLLQLVAYAPFPVTAMAHGAVTGAGADLFVACWHRIASNSATFRMPGWNFGLALGTRRLANLVGQSAARDMLIDTRTISATKATEIGLACEIAEPDDWDRLVADALKRSRALPESSLAHMLELTATDSRDLDIASIVHSAGRPGLKNRILAYREQVAIERSSRLAKI